MNKYPSLLFFIILLFSGCQQGQKVFIAQGIMSGEASENSIILQSRLTAADTLIHGDIPGLAGVGKFELSDDASFANSINSDWLATDSTYDFILKYSFEDLKAGTQYYYRLHYGSSKKNTKTSHIGSFKTNYGADALGESSIVIVTGMNHYHFHYGKYKGSKAYAGTDKQLGYPALKSILELRPDYFIGTGDNVYFDHPNENGFVKAKKKGDNPNPGGYDGKEVIDEAGIRRKYHEQFFQPRFKKLFADVSTYWEKDDHDYRKNDADPYTVFPVSHELGIASFKEQLPVVDPIQGGKTYRTHRINKDLQLWFVEGRDYRDANSKQDGPDKTLWGPEQIAWLKTTLLASDATFKILITPTPMVGPDDAYKKDNHVNTQGFRNEGEAFFDWIVENDFLEKNFYIVCGDRHWQYHATHPKGIEEFSTGALVDNNSRAGRLAGDPKSTDPDGEIVQHYVQGTNAEATGGFLSVSNKIGDIPELHFQFYDEHGKFLYSNIKKSNRKSIKNN